MRHPILIGMVGGEKTWLLWHGFRFEKFTNLPKIEIQNYTMTNDNWTKCLVLTGDNEVKILPFMAKQKPSGFITTKKGGNDDDDDGTDAVGAPIFPTPMTETAAASSRLLTNLADTSQI